MKDGQSWYVARGGEQAGPMTHVELLAFAERGELRPDDQVWRTGLTDWQRAGDVPGLLIPPRAAIVDAPQPLMPVHSIPEPRSGSPEITLDKQVSTDGFVRDPKLVGVRGWLLWFCISLTFIMPVLVLAEFGRSRDEMVRYSASIAGFENYYNVLLGTTLILVIAGVWVGINVWRRSPGAHILARHYLLVQFAVASLAPFAIFLFVDVPPANTGAVVGSQIPEVVKSAVQTLIWYLYLVKSKRVRATFGH